MDEWINVIHIYSLVFFGFKKKRNSGTYAACISTEDPMLGEINQTQKEKLLYHTTYMKYLEKSG